jgi:ABC-type sugar transport system ATPase subunit
VANVSFDDVAKVYPDGARAVSEFDLKISDSECMVRVGLSGSGKTTALRMVAGLEEISEGVVLIGVVNHFPSRDRDVAMVLRRYALYRTSTSTTTSRSGCVSRSRRTKSTVVSRRSPGSSFTPPACPP